RRAGPAVAAVAAVAEKPTAAAAGPAGRTCAAGSARPALADQPGRATGTAGNSGGRRRIAVAAVAIQPSAGPTVTTRRRPVGAIADQRAAGELQERAVDRVHHALLEGLQGRGVGGLGGRVRARTRVEGLHKLVVKRGRLLAELLIRSALLRKHVGDRHRDL